MIYFRNDRSVKILTVYCFVVNIVSMAIFLLYVYQDFVNLTIIQKIGIFVLNLSSVLFTCPLFFEKNLQKARDMIGSDKYPFYATSVLPGTTVMATMISWVVTLVPLFERM